MSACAVHETTFVVIHRKLCRAGDTTGVARAHDVGPGRPSLGSAHADRTPLTEGTVMTSKCVHRVTSSLVVSFAVAAAFAANAAAWIPSVDADEPLHASRAIAVVPDAFERRASHEAASAEAPGRLGGAGCVRAGREARQPGPSAATRGRGHAPRRRPTAVARRQQLGETAWQRSGRIDPSVATSAAPRIGGWPRTRSTTPPSRTLVA